MHETAWFLADQAVLVSLAFYAGAVMASGSWAPWRRRKR